MLSCRSKIVKVNGIFNNIATLVVQIWGYLFYSLAKQITTHKESVGVYVW